MDNVAKWTLMPYAKKRLTLQVFACWCSRLKNQITLPRHDNNHNPTNYPGHIIRN